MRQAKKDIQTMKQDLERHIKDVFNSLGITSPFKVYDCNIDILPEWTKNVKLTNEYFACCQDLSIKKRLQVFIGKTIFENGTNIYWFEGERIFTNEKLTVNELIEEIDEQSVEYLKAETRLPVFLDDFIFNKLNAIYAPDFQRFEYNLDLTEEEILKYLGTYFPRSYAESFCIFDNIFQNLTYRRIVFNRTDLNILSIGSGTGGDIIGLLTSIEKHFYNVKEINICALDGNNEALNILEQIIDNFKPHTSKKINLKTKYSVFDSISDFQNEDITENKYDFILSFKFICEIIALGKGNYDNSYYDFTFIFLPFLSNDGLFVLLDVTTKPKHNTFNPILMNHQVNQALRDLNEYETLLPLPCSVYADKCFCDCFQQKTFTVTHSRHANDKSRVAYRILAPKILKEQIGVIIDDSKQLINNDKICPFTEIGKKTEDAYILKQSSD